MRHYTLVEIDAGGKRGELLIKHPTLKEAQARACYLICQYPGLSYDIIRVSKTRSTILEKVGPQRFI